MSDHVPSPPLPPSCARHPERPAATTCSYCGNFACNECDTLFEERHICATCIDEGRVQAASIAWARRHELGLLTAAWQTVLEVSGDPVGFFDRVRRLDPNLGEAMLFAFVVCVPAGIMGALYNAAIFGVFLDPGNLTWLDDAFRDQAKEAALAIRSGWVLSTLFGAITTPFIVVAWQLISALVHHLFLLLLGGARRDLESTLRVSMFSLGVYLWAVVPVVGSLVLLWVLTCQVIGYSRMHETEWWRSLVAVLAPWCVASCLSVMVIVVLFGAFAAAIG